MDALDMISAGISNAVIATVLALVSFPLCRWAQCPRCGHFLGVLVLAKLITPPMLSVPLAVLPASWSPADLASSRGSRAPLKSRDTLRPSAANGNDQSFPSRGLTQQQLPGAKTVSDSSWYQGLLHQFTRIPISIWLVGLWGAGVVIVGGYQIYVTFRLCLLMRTATPDPRVDRAMHRIARKAGISNYPTARIVSWAGSPMLWGLGSTSVIVLPRALFQAMDDQAADTLLQHELAHFQRGDQWIRILEVIACSVFWWHPVSWIAKYEIELYEEQCCDAWVVQHDPANRRRYAEALLDTVDYISHARETAMPVAASGLGRVPQLQQRLKTIMRGSIPNLGIGKRLMLAGCLMLIPLHPCFTTVSNATTKVDAPLSDFALPRSPRKESETFLPSTKIHQVQPLPSNQKSRSEYAKVKCACGAWELAATSGYQLILREVVCGRSVDLSNYQIACAAFVPPTDEDSPRFVAGCRNGRLLLFDCESGEMVHAISEIDQPICSVCISNSGDEIAIGGERGFVGMVQRETGEMTTLDLGISAVASVRFSLRGRRIVVAEDTSLGEPHAPRIQIWDLQRRHLTKVINSPAPVGVAEFVVDGEPSSDAEQAAVFRDAILTADWDGTVRIWNHGRQIGRFQIPKDVVSAASFSPDSVSLVDLVLSP